MTPHYGKIVFLVCTVPQTLHRRAAARNMYVSQWFRDARKLAEREADEWLVVSEQAGLVGPEETLDPDSAALDGCFQTPMSLEGERIFTQTLFEGLLPRLNRGDMVVILAGKFFPSTFEKKLRARGISTFAPFRELDLVQQLHWLSQA
ncbi:MAG: hypothetical protein U9R40_02545 [Synergistota bacterium]|nr:hypothetical protein [Synergistota bacterium]